MLKPPKFPKTTQRLEGLSKLDPRKILEEHGRMGVQALKKTTPVDTGETANSWSYSVDSTKNGYSIKWYNSVRVGSGVPLVVLLQYGRGSKSGLFVQGRDFINPAIKPVFESLLVALRAEVMR